MYIIHTGDFYYNGADEYATIEEAKAAFEKRKAKRAEEVSEGYPMFDKDYLCEVIDTIDIDKLKAEAPKPRCGMPGCNKESTVTVPMGGGMTNSYCSIHHALEHRDLILKRFM